MFVLVSLVTKWLSTRSVAGTAPLSRAAQLSRNTSWCAKGRSLKTLALLVLAGMQTVGQRVSCGEATGCDEHMKFDIQSTEATEAVPLMVVEVGVMGCYV